MILRKTNTVGPEEMKVESDAAGRVRTIGKAVPPDRAAGESVGIEKFTAAAATHLRVILERRILNNEFYEAAFQELIDLGTAVYAVPAGSFPCMEIDTPLDLRRARRMAARHRL